MRTPIVLAIVLAAHGTWTVSALVAGVVVVASAHVAHALKFCPNCGGTIEGAPKFCVNCGHDLKPYGAPGGAAAPAPAAPAAPAATPTPSFETAWGFARVEIKKTHPWIRDLSVSAGALSVEAGEAYSNLPMAEARKQAQAVARAANEVHTRHGRPPLSAMTVTLPDGQAMSFKLSGTAGAPAAAKPPVAPPTAPPSAEAVAPAEAAPEAAARPSGAFGSRAKKSATAPAPEASGASVTGAVRAREVAPPSDTPPPGAVPKRKTNDGFVEWKGMLSFTTLESPTGTGPDTKFTMVGSFTTLYLGFSRRFGMAFNDFGLTGGGSGMTMSTGLFQIHPAVIRIVDGKKLDWAGEVVKETFDLTFIATTLIAGTLISIDVPGFDSTLRMSGFGAGGTAIAELPLGRYVLLDGYVGFQSVTMKAMGMSFSTTTLSYGGDLIIRPVPAFPRFRLSLGTMLQQIKSAAQGQKNLMLQIGTRFEWGRTYKSFEVFGGAS